MIFTIVVFGGRGSISDLFHQDSSPWKFLFSKGKKREMKRRMKMKWILCNCHFSATESRSSIIFLTVSGRTFLSLICCTGGLRKNVYHKTRTYEDSADFSQWFRVQVYYLTQQNANQDCNQLYSGNILAGIYLL